MLLMPLLLIMKIYASCDTMLLLMKMLMCCSKQMRARHLLLLGDDVLHILPRPRLVERSAERKRCYAASSGGGISSRSRSIIKSSISRIATMFRARPAEGNP